MCIGIEYYIPDNDGEEEKELEVKELDYETIPF